MYQSDKLSARERRQNRNRQHILDTAYQIVVEQGIEALSMRVLAERSDYSPATLYKYFTDKEAILRALREASFARQEQFERTRNIDETLPPPELFYQLSRLYLEFAITYPADYLLMFTAIAYNYDEIITHPNFMGLIQLTQRGVDSGHFFLPKAHTIETLAFQHWLMGHGIVMARLTILNRTDTHFDQLSDQMIRAYINSFSTNPAL